MTAKEKNKAEPLHLLKFHFNGQGFENRRGLTLAHFLKGEQVKYGVVNPLHVKKSKELDDNSPTKNDMKDAK